MKKYKYLIIVIIILIIIGTFLIIKKINKRECEMYTGGGFTLIYNTNSNEKINDVHICIACSPDSYEELPTPKKDGYIFDGWYYDKNFKSKVYGTSTMNINPKAKKVDGCAVGYKDITIYAKWKK